MDTVRRKIYLLKQEMTDSINRMRNTDSELSKLNSTVKEREKKIRELGKAVANKDNELDKAQTKLEQTEKKLKEKSKALVEAVEDAKQLKRAIDNKEARLKVVKSRLNEHNEILLSSTGKADKSEKCRKEVEHRVNFNEDRLQKLQEDIIAAKKMTRETYEKYDECVKKIAYKEKKLEVAQTRARLADQKLIGLEQQLSRVASSMGDKERSREEVGSREERYKHKARQMEMRSREAESRCHRREAEQSRLESTISHLKSEISVVQSMIEEKLKRAASGGGEGGSDAFGGGDDFGGKYEYSAKRTHTSDDYEDRTEERNDYGRGGNEDDDNYKRYND